MNAIQAAIDQLKREILQRQAAILALAGLNHAEPTQTSAPEPKTSGGDVIVARWVAERVKQNKHVTPRKHVWTAADKKAASRRAKAQWRKRKAAGGKATVTKVLRAKKTS